MEQQSDSQEPQQVGGQHSPVHSSGSLGSHDLELSSEDGDEYLQPDMEQLFDQPQQHPVLPPLHQRLVGGLQPDSDAEDDDGHAQHLPLLPSGLESDSDSDDGFEVDLEDYADPARPYLDDGEIYLLILNLGHRGGTTIKIPIT